MEKRYFEELDQLEQCYFQLERIHGVIFILDESIHMSVAARNIDEYKQAINLLEILTRELMENYDRHFSNLFSILVKEGQIGDKEKDNVFAEHKDIISDMSDKSIEYRI